MRLGFIGLASTCLTITVLVVEGYGESDVQIFASSAQYESFLVEILTAKRTALQDLTVHENDCIAISAMWCKLQCEPGPSRPSRSIEHQAAVLSGFIVGRIRITPPRWWIDTIKHIDIDKNLIDSDALAELNKRWKGKGRWRYSGVDDAQMEGDQLAISDSGQVVYLDESLFSEFEATESQGKWLRSTTSSNLIAKMDGDRLYIAFPNGEFSFSVPRAVTCIDCKAPEAKWTSVVHNGLSVQPNLSSASIGGFSEIVVTPTNVVLFGANSFACYFNVYDKIDGTLKVRFVTCEIPVIDCCTPNKSSPLR